MPLIPTIHIDICHAINTGRLLWKKHALERMMERGISRTLVKQAILQGSVIEYYPDDYPVPSVLLSTLQPKPLHVVVAYDSNTLQCHIITAYHPDLAHFQADLKTRRLS